MGQGISVSCRGVNDMERVPENRVVFIPCVVVMPPLVSKVFNKCKMPYTVANLWWKSQK